MTSRFLVTGGGGFVGQWLARALLARGEEVWLSGPARQATRPSILSRSEWDSVRWLAADIRSDADVSHLLKTSKPNVVIHLAGVSYIPDAEGAPAAAYEVNVVGSVRLLSAVVAARETTGLDPKVLVIGSGTQYGNHPLESMPLPECTEQRPQNSYAATKASQEIACLQTARTTGLRVICTRSFSHSGRGHHPVFLLPSLVARVKNLPSTGGVLSIGNDVIRDYLHVEDAVAAYLALVERGQPGEVYNVCSGVGITVKELSLEVLKQAGISAEVVSEPTLRRHSDMPILIGSPKKLSSSTGWAPTKSHKDIIKDLLAE